MEDVRYIQHNGTTSELIISSSKYEEEEIINLTKDCLKYSRRGYPQD